VSWRQIRPENVLGVTQGLFDYAIVLHGRLNECGGLPAICLSMQRDSL
jgi:hypothetical protein